MLLSYDLWHKCDKFISFILLISCHSCRFYFYIKMRSRIYKKTQNFSKLLDPGKTKDRIAKWIVLMLFTYTWSQAHKTVLLRRMEAYSWVYWRLSYSHQTWCLQSCIMSRTTATMVLRLSEPSEDGWAVTISSGWLTSLLPRQMLTSSSSPWTGTRT